MVGAQDERVTAAAHLLIEKSEQVADNQICPQGCVQNFLRVRSPVVSHGIVRRETDTKKIRSFVTAEVFALDGLLDKLTSGTTATFTIERTSSGEVIGIPLPLADLGRGLEELP